MEESGRQSEFRGDPRRPGGRPKCSFCGRAASEVSAIVSGPDWVKICNGCAYGARGARAAGPGRPRKCSFCGRTPKQVEWIYGGSLVAICNECTDNVLAEMVNA